MDADQKNVCSRMNTNKNKSNCLHSCPFVVQILSSDLRSSACICGSFILLRVRCDVVRFSRLLKMALRFLVPVFLRCRVFRGSSPVHPLRVPVPRTAHVLRPSCP